jgi:hypothetical protein
MKTLKSQLKQFPFLVNTKRRIWSFYDDSNGVTTLDMLDTFPLYVPNSAGSYKDRARLTAQTINQIFPFLSSFAECVKGKLLTAENIASVPKTDQQKISAAALKERFDFYGSDKATYHNYHHLYGTILCESDAIKNIFEIGIGTNNINVVSNMGLGGKPGATLRAFRDHCVNASIYGADIDKRILFEEERIATYFVDQTDPTTLNRLLASLSKTFDLVIDDGLHSPNANVESLRFGLQIIRKGGWVVVEDIAREAITLWQVVAALLPSRYCPYLFNADGAVVFAVQRLE